MKPMRAKVKAVLLIVLFVLSTRVAFAQAPSDGGFFYYQLGGAEPLTRTANRHMTSTTLGANAQWNNPFSCGGGHFDPMATVSNQLNGVTQGFQNLMSSVLTSATGAVAGLPGLILARVNPDLYDLMQKGILGAKTDISFAQASCEDVQNAMTGSSEGLDFERWIKISALDDWRHQMQTQPDMIQAKRDVDRNVGNSGTAWIGGMPAGGTGQPEIHVNHDVVVAGFNSILNRGVTDNTLVPASSPLYTTPLVTAWKSPADAARWAVDVVGDSIITTCDTCNKKQGIPGKGLVMKYEEERDNVMPSVQGLVAGTIPVTSTNLEAISIKPSLMVTPDIIKAMQEEKGNSVLVARLASEIAMARTMERAMHLRRLLQAGKREANVAANGAAQEEIAKSLSDLQSDMDGLLYEMNVREKIASNTPEKLLARMAERRNKTSMKEYTPSTLKAGATN